MSPIESLTTWFGLTGHGAAQEGLYRGFCYEEIAELTEGLEQGDLDDPFLLADNHSINERLGVNLKKGVEMAPMNRERTLDDHLDSAWVHLGAALAMVGGSPERLQEAWNRLHRANVDSKVWPDGTFHRDPNGKILKPDGWTPPIYKDLL